MEGGQSGLPQYFGFGSPPHTIGSLRFIQNYIKKQIDQNEQLTLKLQDLQNAQIEFVLLRTCQGCLKPVYIVKTGSGKYLFIYCDSEESSSALSFPTKSEYFLSSFHLNPGSDTLIS